MFKMKHVYKNCLALIVWIVLTESEALPQGSIGNDFPLEHANNDNTGLERMKREIPTEGRCDFVKSSCNGKRGAS